MTNLQSDDWLAAVRARLANDRLFERYARHVDSTVLFDFGSVNWALTITDEGITAVHEDPDYVAWDYAIRGSEDAWMKLLASEPPPPYQDLIGAWFAGEMVIEGDLESAVRDIRPIKHVIDACAEVADDRQ